MGIASNDREDDPRVERQTGDPAIALPRRPWRPLAGSLFSIGCDRRLAHQSLPGENSTGALPSAGCVRWNVELWRLAAADASGGLER